MKFSVLSLVFAVAAVLSGADAKTREVTFPVATPLTYLLDGKAETSMAGDFFFRSAANIPCPCRTRACCLSLLHRHLPLALFPPLQSVLAAPAASRPKEAYVFVPPLPAAVRLGARGAAAVPLVRVP